jgi:hypothetical protein
MTRPAGFSECAGARALETATASDEIVSMTTSPASSRERQYGAASRAAAGMLAPSVQGLPDNVLPAAIAARDCYPEFLARLATRTGVLEPFAVKRMGVK